MGAEYFACSALVMEGVTDTAALAHGHQDTCQARLHPPGPEPYPLLVNILEVSGVPSVRLVAAGFSSGLSPIKVKVKVAQRCLTLCDPMDCSPWNSPGQNTGVGGLSLLQGIFPTQGSPIYICVCVCVCVCIYIYVVFHFIFLALYFILEHS